MRPFKFFYRAYPGVAGVVPVCIKRDHQYLRIMRVQNYSMYVLACPCIIDPSLRAMGITNENDIVIFNRCIERCERFGIEIVALPCPESLFMGKNRNPVNFNKDLDTPEFHKLLDRLYEEVNLVIERKGEPFAILGVDSSPTCGVNFTYKTDIKEPGKGAFLSKFNNIHQTDVKTFSKYRAYLAAPLFSEAERNFNLAIASRLEELFIDVYLPQESGDCLNTRTMRENKDIFLKNKNAIDASDFVVAAIDGADADSGTSWEMGYAYAIGIPIISLRTDFRRVGSNEPVNLMLEEASILVENINSLCDRVAIESGIKPEF